MRHWIFATLVWVASLQAGHTQTLASDRFLANAKGLEIQKLVGSTLVGVTRDTSRIWSLYLAKDRKAYFTFASGKTGEGTYRFRSRDIICFRGLPTMEVGAELCKLANPLGRGLDWRTVTVEQNGQTLTYKYADADLSTGSSQIVYRFKGQHQIDRTPPVMFVDRWNDKVIVGRTVKSKAAWSMQFTGGNQVTQATTGGKILRGTYTVNNGLVCLNMKPTTDASGCFRITRSNGTMLWRNTNGTPPRSEIVYASPRLVAAPQPTPKGTITPKVTVTPKVAIRPKPAPNSRTATKPKAPHQEPVTRFLAKRDIAAVEAAGNGFLTAILEKGGGLRLINGRNGMPYAGGTRFDVTTSDGPARAQQMALAADGKTIVYAAADTIAVMDLRQGMLTHHLTDNGNGSAFRARHIAVSPSGAALVVVDGKGRVYHHNTADMKLNWVHDDPTAPVASIAFLPADAGVFLAGVNGRVALLNQQTGALIAAGRLNPRSNTANPDDPRFQTSAIAAVPNGKSLALSTFGGELVVLDIRGGAMSIRYRKAYGGINDIAFVRLREVDVLALALRGGPAELVEYGTGKRRVRFGPASDDSQKIDLISPEVLGFAMTRNGEKGVSLWAATQNAQRVLQDEWPDQPARSGRWEDQIETARRKGLARETREIRAALAALKVGDCDAVAASRPWVAAQVARRGQNTPCVDDASPTSNTDNTNVVTSTETITDTDVLALLLAGSCRPFKSALRQKGDLSAAEQNSLGQACTALNKVETLYERAQVQLEAGQCSDAAATATSDREAWQYLNKGFKPVSAGRMDALRARLQDRCEDYFLFNHAPATTMYLAAVSFEADGSPDRAKQLYRQVMDSHAADPIALRAADRLIALLDRDTPDPTKQDDLSRTRSPFDFDEIRDRIRDMAPFSR